MPAQLAPLAVFECLAPGSPLTELRDPSLQLRGLLLVPFAQRLGGAVDQPEQFVDDLLAEAAAHAKLQPRVDLYLLRQFGFGAANWVAQWYDPKGPYTPEQIADAFFRYLSLGTLKPEGA